MNDPQKQVIKIQFLEEAQDYLEVMESGLLGISSDSLQPDNIDKILRAAHSLKGGAALMEYQKLSHYAHRLEDFFKILKIGKVSANQKVESLFLGSVDCLNQLVNNYSQKQAVDITPVETKIEEIISQLHKNLGDFDPEEEEMLLAQNAQMDETDMSLFLFETEVEENLNRLENLYAQKDTSLHENLSNFLVDLSGLAQMIDLSAVAQLCESIESNLQQKPESKELIIASALRQLRRSQALVLSKQTQLLPTELVVQSSNQVEVFYSNQNNNLNLPSSYEIITTQEEKEEQPLEEDKEIELVPITTETIEQITDLDDAQVDFSQLQIEHILEEETIVAQQEKQKVNQDQKIRVSAKNIEELEVLFSDLNIERNGIDLQLKNMRNSINTLTSKLNSLEESNLHLRTFYDELSRPDLQFSSKNMNFNQYLSNSLFLDNTSFDSLEMDRYSNLHILAGEMMENIVKIQELKNDLDIYLTDTEKIQRNFRRTSKQIYRNITEVTMRPFSDLLQKFPRALRQMEIEYGKKINFKIKGGNILVDKKVINQLNDPLLHLFRNAFDHGIEIPEIRKIQGKPVEGTIEISASSRGNQTIITIKDDGKGIDLNKIIKKVKNMGLDESDLQQFTEKELLDLIFEPGFSTSSQVTDLSGRGVGMDVVKRNVEDLDGQVTVETKLGVGTTFILSVPFTLSIVKVLLVEVNQMLLAVPSNLVSEVELLETESIITKDGKDFIDWEDEQIKLIKLDQHFQFNYLLPRLEINTTALINQPTMLMIEKDDDLVALKVDQYWGEQEVTIRQVKNYLPLPEGLSGCTILGDGQIVPLVDALQLINAVEMQKSGSNFNTILNNNSVIDQSNIFGNDNQQTVMIIDDSINVRRFLALTLEKQNYRIEQAKDGQEALEALKSGINVQAIICDVEMPRLDGFGFLANLKSDSNLQHIPVMMLTSRSGEKHRKMAANLGADAYFAKPFQEQELLKTIASLITISTVKSMKQSYSQYITN